MKKDINSIKSNQNLFFKCEKCINIPIKLCLDKLRDLSMLLLDTPSKSSVSQSATTKCSLDTSRQIRDSTRSQRISNVIIEKNKRITNITKKNVALRGTSTPENRNSLKNNVPINSPSFTRSSLTPTSTKLSSTSNAVISYKTKTISPLTSSIAVNNNNQINVPDARSIHDSVVVNVVPVDYENIDANSENNDDAEQSYHDNGVAVDGENNGVVNVEYAHAAETVSTAAIQNVVDAEVVRKNESDGKFNKHKHKQLIGSDVQAAEALPSVPRLRFIHVSRLKNTVSEKNLKEFVAQKINLPATNVVCTKLVKKDVDVSQLHFINFKIGVPSGFLNAALQHSMWPVGVIIKPFLNRSKNDLGQEQDMVKL